MSSGYAVITPVHDEAGNLERLVASMEEQTVRPAAWMLVENGSTDETPLIAARLAETRPWLHVIEIEPQLSDERGAPIVAAIHAGLAALDVLPDYVGQLDADLTLPETYFETLLDALEQDARLGIVSGTCRERSDGRWIERYATGDYVWGAARLYRRNCLEQVLPLEGRTGWDTIDVAQANAFGWSTKILRDNPFYHHRAEGSRERSQWSAWAAQGRLSHYIGYRPSYLVARALYRATRDPAAMGLVSGYMGELLQRRPRCTKTGVQAWVRDQQRLRTLWRRRAEARGAL